MSDALTTIWNILTEDINSLQDKLEVEITRTDRAESTDGIPASTLADAPLAATGGVAAGTSFVTVRWISDGRKTGQQEGAGNGTGVLCVYSASGDEWLVIGDYAVVTI